MKIKKVLILVIICIIIFTVIYFMFDWFLKNKFEISQNSKVENNLDNEISNHFDKEAEELEMHIYNQDEIGKEEIRIILDKTETDKYDYNIYSYGGDVSIFVDGIGMPLRDALLKNKVSMEKIIEKANEDFPNALIYKDGGSREFHYDNYTIIKRKSKTVRDEGNIPIIEDIKDVYIGIKNMNINDIRM